jgi:hypothetical protein
MQLQRRKSRMLQICRTAIALLDLRVILRAFDLAPHVGFLTGAHAGRQSGLAACALSLDP